MNAIEFTTELTDSSVLNIPINIASQLPKTGRVRVIVLTDDSDDKEWQLGVYEQFLGDDSEADAIYEQQFSVWPEPLSFWRGLISTLKTKAKESLTQRRKGATKSLLTLRRCVTHRLNVWVVSCQSAWVFAKMRIVDLLVTSIKSDFFMISFVN